MATARKKNIDWLIEPTTGTRYVLDQLPSHPLGRVGDYRLIAGTFSPPATWRDLGSVEEFRNNTNYDDFFHKVFGPEYANNITHRPDHPVDIHAQALILGKSYARKVGGYHEVGGAGVRFWAEFTRIPACWYFLSFQQHYKLLSDDEVRIRLAAESVS